MLIDKKILAGGVSLLILGFALSAIFSEMTPVGQGGMTDEEIAEFLLDERQNQDYTILAGILIGLGFLLILITNAVEAQ